MNLFEVHKSKYYKIQNIEKQKHKLNPNHISPVCQNNLYVFITKKMNRNWIYYRNYCIRRDIKLSFKIRFEEFLEIASRQTIIEEEDGIRCFCKNYYCRNIENENVTRNH